MSLPRQTSVFELKLTMSAKLNLSEAGYHTIDDLLRAPDEELLRVYGVGGKAIKRLNSALYTAGYVRR